MYGYIMHLKFNVKRIMKSLKKLDVFKYIIITHLCESLNNEI